VHPRDVSVGALAAAIGIIIIAADPTRAEFDLSCATAPSNMALARIAWAVMLRQTEYQPRAVAA